MKISVGAVLLVLLAQLEGCCGCPEAAAFRQATLAKKIASMRKVKENGCICGEGADAWYLEQIGNHGPSAVMAMLPYLEHSDPEFSPLYAITVIQAANARGFDATAALPTLQRLSARGDNREVRQMASNAIAQIERRHRLSTGR